MADSKLKINLDMYKKAYLIRNCEEKIVANYDTDVMKTPMHMSMGEEGLVVGVCEALKKDDLVFGTYRSHALYLTRTLKINEFFSEMFGKIDGTLKGKGGSMHLSDPESGFLASSAVVSTTIPLAVGSAFSIKFKKERKVAAVFFGDGAIDEGAFWESLNMACLFKVPVVFVCEDNGFAVHTKPEDRHGYKSILDVVSGFDCRIFTTDSTDMNDIYSLSSKAVEFSRKYQKPAFIYLKYYRYLEHVGTHEDFDAGYRDRKEYDKWLKKDSIQNQRFKLLKMGLPETKITKIENVILDQIRNGYEKAELGQYPKNKELFEDVFSD